MHVKDYILHALRKAEKGLTERELWTAVRKEGYNKTYINFRVRLHELMMEEIIQVSGRKRSYVYFLGKED